MGATLKTRRFSADEFQRMGEAGVLNRDDRVELIDGEIVEMSPIGWRHARCLMFLTNFFAQHLAGRALVSPQNPLRVSVIVQVQPDLMLLRLPLDVYAARHPGVADVLLLVEVADTSLAYDRGTKLRHYAAAGIVECWIVDLEGDAIEVHREPAAGGYRDSRRVGRGGEVSPAAFPDVNLPVADALGPVA